MNQQLLGWVLLSLISAAYVLPTLAHPTDSMALAKKIAEKPNSSKKVILEDRNDLDDVSTNQISQADGGFSWSNMLGMVMQLLFNPSGLNQQVGPSKSEGLDTDQGAPVSPWANFLSVSLKILTALLGGGGINQNDGIDKVDNSSPMQPSKEFMSEETALLRLSFTKNSSFINIVVNLLDALKTSFSHRSLAARSIGKKDSVSEAAVASLSLLKGYMRSMNTIDEKCMQRYICDANKECSTDLYGSSAIYCQLGTYATSLLMQKTNALPFNSIYSAGKRGRLGEDCRAVYECMN
ncbi:uncharacterized protein [Bemisia tabaci]|uniref:uncharacterized protein isoform X2 n=1 Tax=Bemisia tabaci TaxID=7038 RepID=UPI003B28C5C4